MKTCNQFTLLTGALLLFLQCDRASLANPDISWKELDSLDNRLPDEISVFHGTDLRFPLQAWLIDLDINSSDIRVETAVSKDFDRKQTLSDFADSLGALIVVNGGYFLMNQIPTDHLGLLIIDEKLIAPPPQSVYRHGDSYPVSRGAFAIFQDGQIDIAWVSSKNDSLFEYFTPIPNMKDAPAKRKMYDSVKSWKPEYAVQGGPVLISDGKINITTEEEVFFGSTIPNIHPRTAVGYTSDNHLLILIIDGRQPLSRGVSLDELAAILNDLDCVEALNMDGGGSSAAVVDGILLNRPSGKMVEREVMSVITIYYDKE
jgi:exopolysaccharide biosynthesis protein